LRAQIFSEFGNPKDRGRGLAGFGGLVPALAGNFRAPVSPWEVSRSDPKKNSNISMMVNKGDEGEGKPVPSGLPKDGSLSERFAKARRMTVQDVIALVKRGNEDAAELFAEFVRNKFAPGWILYEAAQSGDLAAQESIRELPLEPFGDKAKTSSEIRDL